jgi:hypothetical protein
MIVVVAAVGVTFLASDAAMAGTGALAASLSRHGWGTAEEVPGLAALTAGFASITSVSCASAGNCSAGGWYTDVSRHRQPFVVSQVNGTWGTAIKVPGLWALNHGKKASITSVSCGAAGNCSAGGYYTDVSRRRQPFVVSQVNGTWGTAIKVPGIAALNTGGWASIHSVSCGAAGNCSAGGYYEDSSGNQGFVVSQVNGTWHAAKKVPGLAALGVVDRINSVSCASAGNCSAGGWYEPGEPPLTRQVFVVSQVNGTWHAAKKVPGLAALGTGGDTGLTSVSCGAAGNCSAGGWYSVNSGGSQGFVVSQVNGTWGTAEEVPGLAALNTGFAQTTSVSCTTAGNCSAGGWYTASPYYRAFVVSQVNGTWGTAIKVPGIAALGGSAETISVSCGAAGNCSAGGWYQSGDSPPQAFVVSQVNGTWGTAEEVPGIAALNTYGSETFSVSCAAAGNCSAGGVYTDSSGHEQAFVVSKT